MRSHAMTPKIHVSRLRHALMKLMQATATSTDPYVLDAHKTARGVLESLNGTQQTLSPIYKSDDLSPTGRRPGQPELQHPPSYHRDRVWPKGTELRPFKYTPAAEMTEERAQELLQGYRDTFPVISAPWLAPGGFRNFPCVHVDLASGVDYSVEQHPIQADHASVDDKGNVTISVPGMFGPYTAIAQQERNVEVPGFRRTMTKEQTRRECCRHVWQVFLPNQQADFCVMCYTTRGHIEGFKGMTAVETDEAVQRFRLTCVHQFEDDGVHTRPICFLCGATKQ